MTDIELGDAPHMCHADGCPTPIEPRLFVCPRHWFMLPKSMRDRVWALYRVGQEIRKDASDEYVEHTRLCIAAIATEEAKRASAKVKSAAPSPAKLREAAALKRLVREMGAEVVFSIKPHVPLTKLERMKARAMDVDSALAANWPAHVTAPSEIAVVWDSPEHAILESSSWKLLNYVLKAAGVVNITHTWLVPMPLTTEGGTFRAPLADELAMWRDEWMRQMAAADTRFALLVGGVVGNTWRADVPYGELVGRWGTIASRWWCQMVPHPGMIARGLVSAKDYRAMVGEFVTRVQAGDERASSWLATDCCERGCGERWFAWDRDGLPWCEGHAAAHVGGAAKGGGRRTKRTGQGVLL